MDVEPNTMISHPGSGWRMHWIEGGLGNLQLDIVGFLAILGEDAVRKTSRLASLSKLFLLPRLLPAPHSLLYPERPEQFDVIRAQVSAVYTGNKKDHLTHVTAAMFGFQMVPFEVRCVKISAVQDHANSRAPEKRIQAALGGPVILANLYGCALSLALFIISLIYGDGMSLVATLLLSGLSTLVGFTNHWQFLLPKRPITRENMIPAGDVVVRWPNGSFLVLKCDEAIARELIFAPDSVNYSLQGVAGFMPVSILGTIALMLSVIALANAKIQLQIAWAGAYITLNIAHWTAAALPRRWNFNFGGYEIVEQSLSGGSRRRSYVEALLAAIVITKHTEWVHTSETVPKTEAWAQWVQEAGEVAKTCGSHVAAGPEPPGPRIVRRERTWRGEPSQRIVYTVPDWDARGALSRLMEMQRV